MISPETQELVEKAQMVGRCSYRTEYVPTNSYVGA